MTLTVQMGVTGTKADHTDQTKRDAFIAAVTDFAAAVRAIDGFTVANGTVSGDIQHTLSGESLGDAPQEAVAETPEKHTSRRHKADA